MKQIKRIFFYSLFKDIMSISYIKKKFSPNFLYIFSKYLKLGSLTFFISSGLILQWNCGGKPILLEEAQMTVLFDVNDGEGTPPSSMIINTGASILIPNSQNITKPRHVFLGWSTSKNPIGTDWMLEGTTYVIPKTLSLEVSTLVLYVAWGTTYQVTYNVNEGFGSVVDFKLYEAGSVSTILPILGATRPVSASPSPTDGFFAWGLNPNGTGIFYNVGEQVGFASNTTLYALWYYPISYDCNGGVVSGNFPTLTSARTGADLSHLSGVGCTRLNYIQIGWSTTGFSPVIASMPKAPITLKAVWGTTYGITYDLNGGLGLVNDTTRYPAGSLATIQPITGATGSVFVSASYNNGFFGWGVNPEGTGTTYISGEKVGFASDTTLYALWYYPITFDCNGGDGVAPATIHQRVGANLSTLPNTACGNLDGLMQLGWSVSGNAPLLTTMPNGPINLKAVYLADRNSNGLIEIFSVEELNYVRYNLAGTNRKTEASRIGVSRGCPNDLCWGYELAADIDFANTKWGSAYIGADRVEEGWEPLGTCGNNDSCFDASDEPFVATFLGNGFVIRNLYINRPTRKGIGFFGFTLNTASISQMALEGVFIRGRDDVGGLVGNQRGIINASYATGSVFAHQSIFANSNAGGIVGFQNGTIRDTYFMGSVIGTGNNVGGLVGTKNFGTIQNSYATGFVSGNHYIGGLVGIQIAGKITNSYVARTSVLGRGRSVGGFIGIQLDGSIVNAYSSTSWVTGFGVNVGGFMGELSGGTISNNYATGLVFGSINNIGGFSGWVFSEEVIMRNNYWDTTTTGWATSAGTGATGLATAEMQDATAGATIRGLGTCFNFRGASKYPQLYTWDASISSCTTTPLFRPNNE